MTPKEKTKKRELFQNPYNCKEAGAPFNVIVTHELIKEQKEQPNMIDQAQEKEREDVSGEYLYRMRVPPWCWYIKRYLKGITCNRKERDKRTKAIKLQNPTVNNSLHVHKC